MNLQANTAQATWPAWQPASGLPQAAWAALQQVLASEPLVQQALLFGSRAKGTHRPGSDIDLCLIAPSLPPHELWRLDQRIDALLLPWKVDLVLHHTIDNPDLLAHIQRVGVPFYNWQSSK